MLFCSSATASLDTGNVGSPSVGASATHPEGASGT